MTNKRKVSAKVIKAAGTNTQVLSRQQESEDEKYAINDIIEPPYRIEDLQQIRENSTILGQCIDAYKRNIAGFGHEMKYKQQDDKETPEMKTEWSLVDTEIIPLFSFDKPFKEILETAIDDKETTGNGYIEVIRNLEGKPAELINMLPQYMRVTRKDNKPQDVTYLVNGKEIKRKKIFRRYVQRVGAVDTYFKEFGDPRFLNKETGEFSEVSLGEKNATEVIHLKIGNGPYGIPRWVSHVVHMVGARKAEELNLRYFKQGRHIPMAILLKNGILSEESEAALTDYVSNVEGEDNQYKYLVLQAESDEEGIVGEARPNIDIELKSLADILQKDALFLEYDEKSRQKVQTAFRLPDVYVGYIRDFNRATAESVREITEEQVFEPERSALEYIINNVLLLPYGLKHVYVNLRKSEISNTEDMVKTIEVLADKGGLTFQDVRNIAGNMLNKEFSDYDIPEMNEPVALVLERHRKVGGWQKGLGETLQKSADSNANEDLVNVMKDLRDLLESMQNAED
ncbi:MULTISPECIES: phage portal protein [Bacillus cereus group]|uniref:phage portal protein n=1 Tax=Bacillus cereus group TaxID=86661 RepID=UPI0022E66CA2|nr:MULTISPECIES: phage portal protein [unclassified Bacillus cereus group]MDA2665540.1 phage portal protein [Bacillus cereus group sp. Bc032]MDA2676326.1 phage portal protein [Bacillus cereus group sp. Bc031]MDA2681828.1 phage portal protein [Bacillus cereus group sp. Bc029]MDA2687284.1 phage portal protein [Bacillus cereus group sp. Bc030]MDA2742772.1 phage portal protein [Bacillus cereus group sp. Bc011]